MRKIVTIVFFVALFLFAFQVIIGFPTSLVDLQDSPQTINAESESELTQRISQNMEGVHLVESRSTGRDWELRATSAVSQSNGDEWNLKNIDVQFYSQNRIEFTVTASQGRLDGKTKDMVFKGKVVTKSANGYRYESPELEYKSASRQIKGEGPVQMTGPNDKDGEELKVRSNHLVVYVDDQKMTMSGNVQASKKLFNNTTVELTSASADFSGVSSEANFYGGVEGKLGAYSVQAPSAQFKYISGREALQSILLSGGLKLRDSAQRWASAQNLSFDPVDNKVVLSGSPRVTSDQDEVTGEEIILFEGGRRIKVQNVKAKKPEGQ